MFSKKKRIALIVSMILVILALISGVSSAVVLGKNNQHTYDREVVDVKYLKTAATCERGAVYYKSCECGEASDETFEYGLPLGHDYGTLIAEDPATCTESGVKAHYHCTRCAKDFNESKQEATVAELTIPATGHHFGAWINGKPATETDAGEEGHYNCPDCGKNFESDKKTEIEDIVIKPQHTHSWGTVSYAWDSAYTTCTATRVCGGNATHIETATAKVTSQKTQNLSCTQDEKTTYTATFAEDWCATQTETVTTATALGHSYTNYVSDGNATCTADGTKTAYCDNGCGIADTITEIGSVLGHDYGTPSYVWDATYSTCTATHTCTRSGCGDVETATASGSAIISTVSQNQTCETSELSTLTATFAEGWCTTQIEYNVQTKSPQGHSYTDWINEDPATEDKSGTLGHFDCKNCPKHFDASYNELPNLVIPQLNHVCVFDRNVVSSDHFASAADCLNPAKYYVSCKCGNNGTDTFTDGMPNGHNYNTVTYAWDAGHKTCTATRTCGACSYYETANGAVGDAITQPLTCTANELTTYTATFAESWCVTQTETAITAYATGHSFGTTTYVWDAAHKSCTATRVCTVDSNHVEIATSTGITSNITQNLSCTKDEKTTYTATFGKDWCETQTETVTTATATGHNFTNFVKADCLISAADCDNPAKYYKSCSCGAIGTDTFTDGSALGHNYGTTSYSWDGANTSCTATHTCSRSGCGKVETANGTITPTTTPATCTTAQTTDYTATFTESWCSVQTNSGVVTGTALGHDFGSVSYSWDATHATCTATHTCTRSGCGKVETANGTITSQPTQNLSCTKDEKTTYTATFAEDWCATQTETATTATATGHSYGKTQYSWSSDNLTCTATRTCGRSDCGHSEEEKVNTVKTVTQAVGCEQAELSTFTASFTNKWCEEQTKTGVETATATGHTYGDFIAEVEATCTATGELAHYHCSACGKNFDADYAELSDITIAKTSHKWKGVSCSVCGASRASALTGFSSSFKWKDHNDTWVMASPYTVSGMSGYSAGCDLFIPETYNGLPVVRIDSSAFKSKSFNLVVLPDYLKDGRAFNYIGQYAFRYSTIQTLVFPKTISEVDNYAFDGCTIKKLFFTGTSASEWTTLCNRQYVNKYKSRNSPLFDAPLYYYSESNPFEGDDAVTSGNYWHYDDDGNPAVWEVPAD